MAPRLWDVGFHPPIQQFSLPTHTHCDPHPRVIFSMLYLPKMDTFVRLNPAGL
jgi:hypothetical protein